MQSSFHTFHLVLKDPSIPFPPQIIQSSGARESLQMGCNRCPHTRQEKWQTKNKWPWLSQPPITKHTIVISNGQWPPRPSFCPMLDSLSKTACIHGIVVHLGTTRSNQNKFDLRDDSTTVLEHITYSSLINLFMRQLDLRKGFNRSNYEPIFTDLKFYALISRTRRIVACSSFFWKLGKKNIEPCCVH